MSLIERIHEVLCDLEHACAEARAIMRIAERALDARWSKIDRIRRRTWLFEAVARERADKDATRAEAARRLAERAARRLERAEAHGRAAAARFVADFLEPTMCLQAARERLRDALAELEAAVRCAEDELRHYEQQASWKREPAR